MESNSSAFHLETQHKTEHETEHETEHLLERNRHPDPDPKPVPDLKSGSNPFPKTRNPIALVLEPIEWIQFLSSQLNGSFLAGIFLIFGLSHGFGGSYFKVASDFYWKDVQRVNPSVVQLFWGFYYIPWVLKPIWGLLTDVFPIAGYHRRPYFFIAGIVGGFSTLCLAFITNLPSALALGWMVGVKTGMAIGEVTIDACIARKSIEQKSLAPDIQSLCGLSSSMGSLVGYLSSGVFVHKLGAQEALGLLTVSPAAMILLSVVIYELKVVNTDQNTYHSKEFVGMMYAVGALASIVGVWIYHKFLKDLPFRTLLFSAQLIYGLAGMLDVVFMLRWNLILGIPDYIFVIFEECVSHIISRVRWMPMMVLSTRLCPIGIEGTFFALLMCIDSVGALSSKWAGGLLLHLFHVSRTNFTYLWLVVFIRNILRLATLGLIFLIPRGDRTADFIPSDILSKESLSDNKIIVGGGDDRNRVHHDDSNGKNVELVPLRPDIEV